MLGQRLPARLHSDFLDLLSHNPLPRAGALTVAGTPIDLSRVARDSFIVRRNHRPYHALAGVLCDDTNPRRDRKSVVKGKSVDLGGRRIIKKKKKKKKLAQDQTATIKTQKYHTLQARADR